MRLKNLQHKPCGREEKHLERQARPRGSQAKTLASGYRCNKLQCQGAREGPSPTSQHLGNIAHSSELPSKEDIGRQWEIRKYHLLSRISRSGAGRKRERPYSNYRATLRLDTPRNQRLKKWTMYR
ncbi:hypothetical protein F2Q69_00006621 [Brassica cretica]|uniref:Uncharacterized protein n=1 Tax=Brassica cretica TaxID=69181 RepID=A0A8S9NPI7_BRACR|nr:hypothetical protein F2Q69_00006621 [Brassica cretica]